DLPCQRRKLERKVENVAHGLASGLVRSAMNRMEVRRPIPQRSHTWRGDVGPPSARVHGGNQIEQTALGTAQVAKLIEEENVHRPSAPRWQAPRSRTVAHASK